MKKFHIIIKDFLPAAPRILIKTGLLYKHRRHRLMLLQCSTTVMSVVTVSGFCNKSGELLGL